MLKLCLLYWSEGRELGFSRAPEITYSFAVVVVSNSWGLGGCGGHSSRQVINRTNHPKWGQSLSPFLLFCSCQRWQLFRRKNLYPISPPVLLGFPFHSWPRVFFCSLLHTLHEEENASQGLKAQGRAGTCPSRLPASVNLPHMRSLFFRCLGNGSGQKEETRSVGLIWFIVYGRLPNFRRMAICYISWCVFWYCNLNYRSPPAPRLAS